MKNQCYSPEFRAEAVKLVLEQGLSQEAAAKRRSIPKGTIGNWIVAAKRGGRGSGAWGALGLGAGGGERPAAQGVVRGAAGARHPKKATAYLAKESLPSTRS